MSDHLRDIERYVRGVQSGAIPAGRMVRLAVERHLADLADGPDRGLYFDGRMAERACSFFPCLQHTTGEFAGRPFELELWQKFLVGSLFGWRRRADRLRRFRKAFVSIARGNGKSPLGAGIATKLWSADDPVEPRAEVYTAATRKAQARIVWDEARRFVDRLPKLKKHVVKYDGAAGTRMVLTTNESKLEVLEYSPSGHDGQVTHGAIVDELHAFRSQHRLLLDNLATSMSKRRQPLFVVITTAGGDESILWEAELEYCRKVVEGIAPGDDQFVLVYELDEDDDIHDEANWIKANPNLGVSVQLDGLRSLSEKAKHDPETRRVFRRYHCNLKTSSLAKIIPAERWAQGAGPLPALDGLVCHGGIDIGWRDDLAAFALVFPIDLEPEEEGGEPRRIYALRCRCWIPRECKRDLAGSPWAEWIAGGQLIVTPGNTTDPEAIYAEVALAQKRFQLRSVALDGSNARAIGIHLLNTMGIQVYEHPQNARKYNEPTRAFLTALDEGRVRHGGDPLLGWAASNLVTKADANDYIMPAKAKSVEKIDPVVATLMAFGECLYAAAGGGPSPYDKPGGGVILI